ncbi:MAG: transporter ATP-binding protein [Bacteroidota bacterium]|jgi:phospholipid/cholesterol/gamma-HCH transport system ATP-binding protein|nr:transporter ATP-binding protein [Bacteroidota bacterium]
MIEIKNISKSFSGRNVLNDISFTFQTGKTNMIIGESGSGKTTLLKCMVGLNEINEGQILYDGRSFTELDFKHKKEIRKEIGMLFQGGALFDSKTVEENVVFPLSMFTDMSESEKRDRANFCLQRVNLLNANNLFPSEISGGMKKRVAIARAIAVQPKYLFCDEPNSGLDPKTSIVIDNLIKEITEEYNITTIVITHDMNSVIEIGDRIMFIYKGNKHWEGTKEEILKTSNQEVCDFVYATKFMKDLKTKF